MDDRKQEAIEIIGKFLDTTHDCGRLQMQRFALSEEKLYDRLAPLMRGEFPDKALKDLLFDSASSTPEALFWAIKCLIEGQPKGTCQTCGGSGKNELAGSSFVLDGFSDECSDCNGTGDQPATKEEAK